MMSAIFPVSISFSYVSSDGEEGFPGELKVNLIYELNDDNALSLKYYAKTNKKLDKDRFRQDLGGMLDAYREVADRLGLLHENEPPRGKGPVLVKTD